MDIWIFEIFETSNNYYLCTVYIFLCVHHVSRTDGNTRDRSLSQHRVEGMESTRDYGEEEYNRDFLWEDSSSSPSFFIFRSFPLFLLARNLASDEILRVLWVNKSKHPRSRSTSMDDWERTVQYLPTDKTSENRPIRDISSRRESER